VAGLPTDYCVRASGLDALTHGFEVQALTDAGRGVDRQPGDSERALHEMQASGATLTTSEQLLAQEASQHG
jgi:nicotinamidase/pyrazinamidase